MSALEHFEQLFSQATEAAGDYEKQPRLTVDLDEDDNSWEKFDLLGRTYGPQWQRLVDAHRGLSKGQERLCDVSLDDTKFLFRLVTAGGEVVASEMTNTLQVRVTKTECALREKLQVARCEFLIEGVKMPTDW